MFVEINDNKAKHNFTFKSLMCLIQLFSIIVDEEILHLVSFCSIYFDII